MLLWKDVQPYPAALQQFTYAAGSAVQRVREPAAMSGVRLEAFTVDMTAAGAGDADERKREAARDNQLINVAVAEKVSALRTEEYFAERAGRGNVSNALRILKRAGVGNPPLEGDDLPPAGEASRTVRRRPAGRRC